MILTNCLFLSTLCYLPCIYVQGSDWSPLDWEPVGHQKQLVPWGNDVRDIMGFYEKRLDDDAMQNHHQEQGVNVQDLTDYMSLLRALRLASLTEPQPSKRQTKKAKPCYWSLVSCYRRRRRSVEES